MDSFTKQGLILGGVVVVGLVVLLLLGRKDSATTGVGTLTGEQQLASSILKDDAPAQPTVKDIDPKKWFAAPRTVGIPEVIDLSALDAPEALAAKALKAVPHEGMLDLIVEIRSTGRCMSGDLDLMLDEVADDPAAKFLLSIEPISGSGEGFGPESSVEINPTSISGGVRKSLAIPVSQGTRHLGLFVCRDSRGSGRCNDKPVANISRLIEARFENPSIKAQDRIYYFNYLLQQNNTITLATNLVTDDTVTEFREYVGRREPVRETAISATSTAVKLFEDIRSLPAKLRGTSIIIDLPRNDRGKCFNDPSLPKITPEMVQSLGKADL